MKKIIFLSLLALSACTGIKEPAKIDGSKVYFDFDSAEISKSEKSQLLGQSLYLKNNPDIKILIEGHCDERGTTEYNLALGALRAGNSRILLIKDGIESARIKTISYGKERPSVLGASEEAWQQNRNTTTILLQ